MEPEALIFSTSICMSEEVVTIRRKFMNRFLPSYRPIVSGLMFSKKSNLKYQRSKSLVTYENYFCDEYLLKYETSKV